MAILHLVGAGKSHSLVGCCWLHHCPLAQRGYYPRGGDPLCPRKSNCCPSNEGSVLLGVSRWCDEGPARPPAAAHISIESLLEQVKDLRWHSRKSAGSAVRGTKQPVHHLQTTCKPALVSPSNTLGGSTIFKDSCSPEKNLLHMHCICAQIMSGKWRPEQDP